MFVQIVVDNAILFSGAVISLLFFLLFAKVLVHIRKNGRLIFGKNNVETPADEFKRLFKGKHFFPKVVAILIISAFCCVVFCFLSSRCGVVVAALFCVPLGIGVTYVLSRIIWLLYKCVTKAVALDSPAFNILFSIGIVNLVIVHLSFFDNAEKFRNSLTFALGVYNLLFGYVVVLVLLFMLLRDALSDDGHLTYKNLWKATLLIIFMFIVTLTALSYIGALHYRTGFNMKNMSYFDSFYYTCVTFSTVGYGDICPTAIYNKLISILTLSTSVITITVLLSTMLSVRKQDK